MFAVETTKHIVIGRPLHIVADEQIEQAVAVVIEPDRRRAEPYMTAKAAGFSYINKCSFAGVLEQAALTDTGDEDVGESVIVVVADCDSHAVHLDIKTGFVGNVDESPVAIIVVKTQCASYTFMSGPIGSVDQQDVLPAVSVVIKKRAA